MFESIFESRNLRQAIQVYEFEYDLIWSRTTTHTDTHSGSISEFPTLSPAGSIVLTLLTWSSLIHSTIIVCALWCTAKSTPKSTERLDPGISRRLLLPELKEAQKLGHYCTFTFRVQFNNDNDTVCFAHSYPYTYSDLARYLNTLEADPKKKLRFRWKRLC